MGAGGKWRYGARVALIVAALCITVAAAGLTARRVADPTGWMNVTLVVLSTTLAFTAAAILITVAFQYGAARRAFYERVRLLKAAQVEQAVMEVGHHLTLNGLFVLNRRQLDEYHVLSVRQASLAFRNAQAASIVAFVILIAGAIIALRQQDDSGRYVAAGLSALGAALSAFLSRVFFRSYQDTRDQLRQYYYEPFRTSQVLALERLARTSGKEEEGWVIEEDLRKEIVLHLLNQITSDSGTTQTLRRRRSTSTRSAKTTPKAGTEQTENG